MNFQHVSIKAAKTGGHPGGLRGLVVYNERLRQDLMTQAVRYIEREDGYTHKEDLVDKGKAHLPAWAKDTVDFFSKAEQYGRQNHWAARVIEVALPRELSAPGRRALADAIRDTYFSQHPHSWAIHNPTASDGGEQPHLHLIVSMRVDDGIAREPQQWFRNYNPAHPERGGAYRYDTFDLAHRANVGAFRHGIARLTNCMLEHEGQAHRVYAGTLKSLWIDREAAKYLSPKDYKSRDPEARKALRDEVAQRYTAAKHQGKEQEYIQAEWHKTKRIHHYDGLTMDMAVDYERGRFYEHDTTPWRERERTANRAITRARERAQARAYQKRQPRRALVRTRAEEGRSGGGLNVQLRNEWDRQDAGRAW